VARLVELPEALYRLSGMWRCVAIGVLLTALLAGCSWTTEGQDSASSVTAGWTAYPVHKFRVPNGTTRSYPRAALVYPLTVICPNAPGSTRTGFHQVIRSPIENGVTFYGGSANGTSIEVKAQPSGPIKFTCS